MCFIEKVVRKTLNECRHQKILADIDRIKKEYGIKTRSEIEAEKLKNFESRTVVLSPGFNNSSIAKKNRSAYMRNWRNKIRSVN